MTKHTPIYTVTAGRCIERDGKPFVTLHRCTNEKAEPETPNITDQDISARIKKAIETEELGPGEQWGLRVEGGTRKRGEQLTPSRVTDNRNEPTGSVLPGTSVITLEAGAEYAAQLVRKYRGRHVHLVRGKVLDYGADVDGVNRYELIMDRPTVVASWTARP